MTPLNGPALEKALDAFKTRAAQCTSSEGTLYLNAPIEAAIQAYRDALPQSGVAARLEREFPIIKFRKIPWEMAERAYEAYAKEHGTQQTLERMAERGGFWPGEMDKLLPGWREELSEITRLRNEIAELRAAILCGNQKADEEMERVKACEHIALGDEGWEVLRNLCPSTAAVAWLRDQLSGVELPGWRLAPVEATEEMLAAAYALPGPCGTAMCEAIYRAMLAAAPPPPVTGDAP